MSADVTFRPRQSGDGCQKFSVTTYDADGTSEEVLLGRSASGAIIAPWHEAVLSDAHGYRREVRVNILISGGAPTYLEVPITISEWLMRGHGVFLIVSYSDCERRGGTTAPRATDVMISTLEVEP